MLQSPQPNPVAAQILAKQKYDNYGITPILTLIMEKSCILFKILFLTILLINLTGSSLTSPL